jgi:NTP pyrophosphatase (non-canonical NTP hydrolase)
MSSPEIKPLVSPWIPTSNPRDLKILGKALEEAGEYTSAVARCLIQGIDESEPVTGKPNRQWLEEEIADVMATVSFLAGFGLDVDFIEARAEKKREQLNQWFEMDVNEAS